jgi:starch synthase
MFIVMISPECAPVAKVGGLGDMVHGLARQLSISGNKVELILPMYDCLQNVQGDVLQKIDDALWVPYHEKQIPCDVHAGEIEGLDCFFLKPNSPERFFERGKFYGEPDDPARFACFSRAALEFLHKRGRQPDIIHCHDWQTGLVPVLLYETFAAHGMTHPRVCYTLHNLGHQGITGAQILQQVGLNPTRLMVPERLLDPSHADAVNLLKGGIVYANSVTTVSPRYAQEIRHSHLGEGLQDTLNRHAAKLGGVLNGIDYTVWNPQIDSQIPANYGEEDLSGKLRDKKALRRRLLLQDVFKPIVAVVSRLDRQKGADLIRHAVFYSLANHAQFVLLGSAAEEELNAAFWGLKEYLNDNPDCHLEIGYDEPLSHLIYAGADILVIPSVYEPCGLTQMIAMRYGTVPVVRNTGGLADTVFDANYSEVPFEQRNGYVFNDLNVEGLESALSRAIGLWYRYPEYFRQLRSNGMQRDFSWRQPANEYQQLYATIRNSD